MYIYIYIYPRADNLIANKVTNLSLDFLISDLDWDTRDYTFIYQYLCKYTWGNFRDCISVFPMFLVPKTIFPHGVKFIYIGLYLQTEIWINLSSSME